MPPVVLAAREGSYMQWAAVSTRLLSMSVPVQYRVLLSGPMYSRRPIELFKKQNARNWVSNLELTWRSRCDTFARLRMMKTYL